MAALLDRRPSEGESVVAPVVRNRVAQVGRAGASQDWGLAGHPQTLEDFASAVLVCDQLDEAEAAAASADQRVDVESPFEQFCPVDVMALGSGGRGGSVRRRSSRRGVRRFGCAGDGR